MAIRPEIALQTRVPDVGQIFNNALIAAEGLQGLRERREQAPIKNRLLESQAAQTEAGATESGQLNRIRSLALFGSEIQGDLQSGNLESIRAKTVQRISDLPSQGLPANDSTELLQILDDPNVSREAKLQNVSQLANAANQRAIQFGALKAPGGRAGLASAKTEILPDGSVVQALPSGDVQVRNPAGDIVVGQDRANTLRQSQQFAIEEQRQEAGVAVERARGIARAGAREQRASTIKTELATRNRNAARESVRLNQALKVASEATQGTLGATKLKMAKLLPDIDVNNEALLDQSLTQLALDQLQNFKGPTTDFEFGVTQNITGQLGDAKSANIAKLNSLQRANWFNKREFDQFNRHVRSGGDPDTFSFNFGEPMKTKKGVFTLQDIQDTAVANNLSIEDTIKRLNR